MIRPPAFIALILLAAALAGAQNSEVAELAPACADGEAAPPPGPITDGAGFIVLPGWTPRLCPDTDSDYFFTERRWVVKPGTSCGVYEDVTVVECAPTPITPPDDDPETPEPIADPVRICDPCEYPDEDMPIQRPEPSGTG